MEPCKYEHCTRPVAWGGMCQVHAERWLRKPVTVEEAREIDKDRIGR